MRCNTGISECDTSGGGALCARFGLAWRIATSIAFLIEGISVMRMRYGRSALLGLALLGLTGAALGAPPAFADQLPAPTVGTWSAPDGVFVDWDDVNPSGYYRVTRTVDGVSTTQVSWGSHFSDAALQPGQEATYVVEAYVSSTETGVPSTPVTDHRAAEGWTAPDGAVNAIVIGSEGVAANPWSPPVRTELAWDDLTAIPSSTEGDLAIGRLPGVGSYPLSETAAPGSVLIRSGRGCSVTPPGDVQGTIMVYDVVYGASGTPLELGADLAWTCQNGPVQRASVRIASPQPFAHVVADKPARTKVEEGKSATATWRLHNDGSQSAVISGAEVSKGTVDATDCATAPLAAGSSCNVVLTMPGSGAELDYYDLTVDVDGQPSAGGMGEFSVVPPLAPPTVRLEGRLPHAAEISWDGGAPGLGSVKAYRVERLAADGSWQVAGSVEPTVYTWTARDLRPGQDATFRVEIVNSENQVSQPSTPVSVTTPLEGVLWLNNDVRGGSNTTDPGSVSVIPSLTPYGPVEANGIDVAPDRRHLAVTTGGWTRGDWKLLVTDLDGTNQQVLYAVTDTERGFTTPRFSPDGRRVVIAYGPTPQVVDIATKTVTSLDFHQGEPSGWAPDAKRMLLRGGLLPSGKPDTGVHWGPTKAGDATVTQLAGTAGATGADVSRTGAVAVTMLNGSSGGDLRIIPPQGGAPVTVWQRSDCSVSQPRFDPTGSRILVLAGGKSCTLGNGRFVLTLAPSGPVSDIRQIVTQTTGLAAWEVPTTIAPTAKVTIPAITGPTTPATITAADADDAISGLTRRCRLDAGAWTACGASWTVGKLTGGRHTIAAAVTDPAGNTSPTASVSWTVDAAAPTVSLTQPASPVLGSALTLRWTGTDTGGAGVDSYDVRVRYASPYGAFSAYTQPASWQGLRTSALNVKLSQGYTYCYAVRARDKAGNLGGWSTERCATSALDDRALSVSTGVVRGASTAYTYGTYSRATTTARTFTRTGIQARRLAVVVTTCPTCGSIDVTHAGVYLGRISLTSTTTRVKQLRWLLLQSTTRTGTVSLRTLNTRPVVIDGLVVQH